MRKSNGPKSITLFTFGLLFCLAATLCPAADVKLPPMPDGPYKANWESLKKYDAAPEWFRDAKFGIYFHWGVYSVPAFGSEWYPRWMHFEGHETYKHHVEKYGHPSKFGYHDFVPMFEAEKFDAEEWAELFKKAGARFAGPVAEHHDGFSMWASEVNPWNVGDMGPKRDITGELAKACRKRGMYFVATFHHARNMQRDNTDGKPFPHRQYFRNSHYPPFEGTPTVTDDPLKQILYGRLPEEEFLKRWKGKLYEVVDKYQPDLIWFDSWLDQIPEKDRMEFCAYYLNRAHEWGKGVVITRKQDDLPLDFTLLDLEKGRMNELTENTWLTDDTISKGSWCYTEDLEIKPMRQVLHVLIDIVSKNGQLLLNISPKADGSIPGRQKEVILGVGAWLKKYGEAIYETRPWTQFGEGPTRLKEGGGFTHKKSGYLQYTPHDVRFTQSKDGKNVYAIVLGWAGAGEKVTIEALAKGKGPETVKSVQLFGHRGKIKSQRTDKGLVITLPKKAPSEDAIAFRIGVE